MIGTLVVQRERDPHVEAEAPELDTEEGDLDQSRMRSSPGRSAVTAMTGAAMSFVQQ